MKAINAPMDGIESDIARAVALRLDGAVEAARALLEDLARASPDHALLRYQLAWTCDVQCDEHAAVPHYERALELGVDDPEARLGAMLGLGSTYRTIGRYDEAVRVLSEAREAFPERRELDVFLAMACYNRGDHSRAMELLLRVVADTSEDPGVRAYRRAIAFYSDQLDRRW